MPHPDLDPAHGEVRTAPTTPLEVLYASDSDAAVTFTRGNATWLILEEAYYEPLAFEAAQRYFDCTDSVSGGFPFKTEGERKIVNTTTGQILEHPFDAMEGGIQGLVYAVQAILHGGILPPERYERYIYEELVPEDFAAQSESSLIRVDEIRRHITMRGSSQ